MRGMWEVFKRELKSYFESPVAYVFLIVYLALTGFLTFLLAKFYELGQADLHPFFNLFPWTYLILVPAVSMRLWSEERRSQTIEVLLTLPLTLTQAIAGKFLAAWVFLGLALALTFPIVITTAFLGDPDNGAVWGGYAASFMLAGAYLSVGMAASAMTRNQVISFVLAAVACLCLLLVGFYPFTDMLVKWAPDWLVDGVAAFGVMRYYESMVRGVLDVRDIGYYMSVMAVMLTATHVLLHSKKAA